MFRDRTDAGQRLAARLQHLKGRDVVVLGLPRGGVPVAFEVARALGAPLDVIVVRKLGVPFQPELGMGADGHTASIFPGPDLDDALNAPKARRMVGVMPEPLPKEAPVPRVTLTRAAILSARTLLITISGDDKRAVLEQAIADGQSSRVPIGRVLAEAEQPIDIHWCP